MLVYDHAGLLINDFFPDLFCGGVGVKGDVGVMQSTAARLSVPLGAPWLPVVGDVECSTTGVPRSYATHILLGPS